MNSIQPLALRMPHVFEGPRSFSSDDVRTQTQQLGSPPAADRSDPLESPPALPIMGNQEADYFNHFSPGTNETYITATPQGSQTETTTWSLSHIPYEIDLDLYTNHKLDPKGTRECLEKAHAKFLKSSNGSPSPRASPPNGGIGVGPSAAASAPTSPRPRAATPRGPTTTKTLSDDFKTSVFNRVVLIVGPNPSARSSDLAPLSLHHLAQILGDDGLLGFFEQTRRFYEAHFRIRDVSVLGRGRYVAMGKVKRGTFRGSGGASERGSGGWGGGGGAGGFGGGGQDFDGATLDGERSTNAEFEAFKSRIDRMNFR